MNSTEKQKNKIDYNKENIKVRKFDAKQAIQNYYLSAFPNFLRIPLTFLLNWKVILFLTIIGPLGSSLMHGNYPKLGLFLMMLMVIEHHCYFFEFFFIVIFYYLTEKQRLETKIALKEIATDYCLSEDEIKVCNRSVLLKIGLLAFFLGSCGWAVAGIYLPVIQDWIVTGTLIIPEK